MTFLPIVGRELRVASRRRGAWLARVTSAFIAIAIGAFILLVAEADQVPTAIGKEMFTTVAGFLFIYVLIAGALVTCDCLAEEKREGTLGLLFLTDLKGYDVVFGKLAATSLNTIYGMLAVVPLMAIPILMGGVSNAEFWRVVIVACNLLLFSLSVGILASSISRSDHRAMLLSFVIVVAMILIPWLLSLHGWGRRGVKEEWLVMLSPATSCFIAFDDNFRAPQAPAMFWTTVAVTQIFFWVFILIACRVVPKSWQETGERLRQRGFRASIRQLLEGSSDARKTRRARMLDINPYYWRAARTRAKDSLVWILIIGGGLFWLWMRQYSDSWFDATRDIFIMVIVNAALKWWVASEAARNLSDDRRSGGLELLLSTPLREDEILRGQRRALLHQFAAPVGVVLLADFVSLLMSLKRATPDERSGLLMIYFILGGFLVFDMIALGTVGMWLGLSGRKTNRATIVGLLRIVVVPSVAFTVITAILAVVSSVSNGFTPFGIAWFWIFLCTITNLVFMTSANNHLRQFRDIVAQRFATKGAEDRPQPAPKQNPPQVAMAK
jgi:ABC-type transport system involved in cytochrome c biogenesis permease component